MVSKELLFLNKKKLKWYETSCKKRQWNKTSTDVEIYLQNVGYFKTLSTPKRQLLQNVDSYKISRYVGLG